MHTRGEDASTTAEHDNRAHVVRQIADCRLDDGEVIKRQRVRDVGSIQRDASYAGVVADAGGAGHFGCNRAPPSTRMTSALTYELVSDSRIIDASSSAVPSRLGNSTSRLSFSLNASLCGPLP